MSEFINTENPDITELEYDCIQCAEYVMNRIDNWHGADGYSWGEAELAMWIHDHMAGAE